MNEPAKLHFEDHFSATADQYAIYRPSYPMSVVDFLAGLAPRTEVAWDAGCGSGQFSSRLAERFERVIATDASAGQIAAAKPHPKIEYRVAPAEASGLSNASVDLAVTAQAAHWFDLPAYYAEVRRVARANAIVALVSYGILSVADDVDPVLHHFHIDELAPYWPPERKHVDNGYRTLAFPFEEIAAPALEIRANWTLSGLLGYVETWSAVMAMAKARGREPIDAFRRELARVWGSDATVRCVRWPLTVRAGRVG
jgi:SAM-dependent methyltransferase